MKRECDRLFSLIVRARHNRCEDCSRHASVYPLQCAHVFIRKHQSVRWSFENALALCDECHKLRKSAHPVKPSKMQDLYVAIRGYQAWDRLVEAVSKDAKFRPELVDELRRAMVDEALGGVS